MPCQSLLPHCHPKGQFRISVRWPGDFLTPLHRFLQWLFCTFTLPSSHSRLMTNPSKEKQNNTNKTKPWNRISYFQDACQWYNQIVYGKAGIYRIQISVFSGTVHTFPLLFIDSSGQNNQHHSSSQSRTSVKCKKRFLLHKGASQHKAWSKKWFSGLWPHVSQLFCSEIFSTLRAFLSFHTRLFHKSLKQFRSPFSYFQIISKSMIG